MVVTSSHWKYFIIFKGRRREMKKILVTSLALIGGLAICSTASAVITGSAHDFKASAWNTTGQICIPCHAPHNNQNAGGSLLWNHDLTTSLGATTTYTLYDSPTYDANGTGALATTTYDPAGVSKFCLSCHDGTIAIDAYTNHAGTAFVSGVDNLSNALGNDHPISFLFDATLVATDGGLKLPTGNVKLFAGKMECASCHDVHNKYGNTAGLLNVSNAASALCLSCHVK